MLAKDEVGRLAALRELGLLDSPASEAFDRIIRLASRLLDVPVALVSLIDQDRQWFKSRVGLAVAETPREHAFCAHTITSAEVMVVPDATQDARFSANPLVLGDPNIRFYAGAPLITREGFGIGSLCVIDTEPRLLRDEDRQVLTDLAAMVMAQIELRHAVGRLDPVSSLPNRTQFVEDLDDLARDQPGRHRVGVLIDTLELEQLSGIARALGPGCTEELVRSACGVVRRALDTKVGLYHVGVTQFAFLLHGAAVAECQAALETVLAHFERPIWCGGIPVPIPACAGLVLFQLGTHSGQDVLRMALAASHDARAADQRWAAYRADTDTAHRRAFTLLSDMPQALETPDEFALVYQPRVAAGSGCCVGAEALLRWRHPRFGMVAPGEFIPLVEQTALARPVTDWVMDAALRQARVWRERGLELRVSVNVSARNLEEEDLVDRLTAAMRRHAVGPEALELEFTETALMRNGRRALQHLRDIRSLGVEIAIDDFGTGYANLSYLRRLPASTLKLDQSFIGALAASPADRTIVRTMIAMAHDLGFRVVAEGVETQEVLDLLEAWSADEVQGYFISRPLDPAALHDWIAAGSCRTIPYQGHGRTILESSHKLKKVTRSLPKG